ncbi:MAG: MotA/TolQ/ExbB proton channel family protein [Phycisphaeraceae bacterium]|nr:MotA/TolQ/ExbB proton channel family protein [Phycisphaeraceae bacterium]
MTHAWESFLDLMHRGGPIMWPILALSFVGLTLTFERAWFWLRTNSPGHVRRLTKLAQILRSGDRPRAEAFCDDDASIYGRAVASLLHNGVADATITEAVETQRARIERFMPTLSTIITAAPMLGILGTVTGIISSFNILSDMSTTDPRAVSQGIAEALLTTVAGLVVAIVILFPYNAFRSQIERSLARLEMLAAAADHGLGTASKPSTSPPTPQPAPPAAR